MNFLDHKLIHGDCLKVLRALDEAASTVGVDFIGGFSAMVEKHASRKDRARRFVRDPAPRSAAEDRRGPWSRMTAPCARA